MTAYVMLNIDGTAVRVPAGITVAAALRHAGEGYTRQTVGGVMRAPLCGMGICHECRVLVQQHRVLACQTLCQDGMVVETGVRPARGGR